MTLEELRCERRADILAVAAKYGASNVRVYGSVARSEQTPSSDIDFLVDLEPNRSLMDLGGLLMALRALLGQDVDVSTESMLRKHIRERALHDAIAL